MARIRTVKPEFCSSADVGALSRDARLFFILALTEADDEGRMLWIPRRLSGVLYPFDDDVTPEHLDTWAAECETRGMVKRYVVANITYLAIVKWAKHQKISHPTASKYPPPDDVYRATPESFQNDSRATPESFRTEQGTGNREMEQGEGNTDPDGSVVPAKPGTPPCPHIEIVALYHEFLPSLTRVKEWTPERQAFLRKRWNESSERQNLDWWRDFFGYVAESEFLTGKINGHDGRAFECDLEWLVRPKNFVKVIEGKYENRGAAA